MSPSKILFLFCISFITGIFLESIVFTQGGLVSSWGIPQILIWGFLFVGIILIFSSFFFNNNLLLIGFLILFLAMGVLRFQISEFNITDDKLRKLNDKGEITLVGIINSEPDVRDTYQKIKVKVGDSIVLVMTKLYPEYKYLDQIKLTGKLETPGEIGDDVFSESYKNYLMKDHIYSIVGFPKIDAVPGEHRYNLFTFLYEKILFCKQKIRANLQHNFLPPYSSILEGTVLGDNGAMTTDLKDKLNVTGLRHIIAVSGTHVVILSAIIMSLLMAVGLWRGQAFYIAIILICVYIVLTGLPPSGVRAGIMGGIYLLSQKVGRQTMGSRLITLAAAVMLLINPLLLSYDVGFQLSFLAVLGLIYLEPFLRLMIKKLIKQPKGNVAENFIGIISTTFAAQIFTLPIMVYNFGNISFVSPVTNLLILPIVYWLMVFGFLTSIIGIFSNFLGWILSIPCWFLLAYFMWVIDFFSQPWASKIMPAIHWIWLVISYSAIFIAVWFLNKKYRREFT